MTNMSVSTWTFYTIAKSLLHENSLPWKEITLSGWVVDGYNEKYSKSKENAKETPAKLLQDYFADGVRYWAGSAKFGKQSSSSQ